MTREVCRWWVALLLMLPLGLLHAQSSVWMVEKGDSTVWLAGSVHLLRAKDYPLPDEFEQAYARSDQLVFETDVEANPADLQQVVLSEGLYPAGKTLATELPREVYDRLATYCRQRSLDLASLQRFRPWLVAMTLSLAEMQMNGFQPEHGVDGHFQRRARQDGKTMLMLERSEEQIALLASIDRELQSEMILQFLDEREQLDRRMAEMVTAWRDGDAEALDALSNAELRRYPGLYAPIIEDRNRRWLPKIERLLDAPSQTMVVVGSAHLVGESSVVKLLRDQGYRVELWQP